MLNGLRPSSHMPGNGHLVEVEKLYNPVTQRSPARGGRVGSTFYN